MAVVLLLSLLHPVEMSALTECFTVIRSEDFQGLDSIDVETKQKVAAIFTTHNSVDGPLLNLFPNVKVISTRSVGFDHVDLRAAAERGIRVGHTPGVLNDATAEVAMSLVLMTARRLSEGERLCRRQDVDRSEFVRFSSLYLGQGVSGRTLGIVGMGRIGRRVAHMAHHGFGMSILYHNKSGPVDAEVELGLGATYHPDLLMMLGLCDFVVLLAPKNPSTHNLMGKKEFAAMKKTSIFVNVSRGALVDHDALIQALDQRAILGAGLDVTDPEPLPRDHPLLRMPNVVVTPHLGSATIQTRTMMTQMAIANIQAVLQGKTMPAEVPCTHTG